MEDKTFRYATPVLHDTTYMAHEFSKTCETIGTKIKLYQVTNREVTKQGENIYTRDEIGLDGYCMIEDYIPSSDQLSENYQNDKPLYAKVLYIPVLYGLSFDKHIDFIDKGSLVEIVDDLTLQSEEFGTYILEECTISPDRIYWVCNAFIHRTTQDTSAPDPGGIKPNFSFLKNSK